MIGPESTEKRSTVAPSPYDSSFSTPGYYYERRVESGRDLGIENTFTSNFVILMSIIFGLFLIFIGGIIVRIGGYDAFRVGTIIIQLGIIFMILSLLTSAIFRNDFHIAIRVGLIVFSTVLSYCLVFIAHGG